MIFSIFGALAEFERELIRERTMQGITAARAKEEWVEENLILQSSSKTCRS